MQKIVIFLCLSTLCMEAGAQKVNWQNLDLKTDSVFGISTEKAYRELLPKKKATTVLVAVIDGGVDTAHEDLKAIIWNNPKEKAGNGKDDDRNGYTDDIYGWNFIGGPKGDVNYDNLELVRILRRDAPRYDTLTDATVSPAERPQWENYRKMKAEYDQAYTNAQRTLQGIQGFKSVLDRVVTAIGKDTPTIDDFKKYIPKDPGETQICKVVVSQLEKDPDYIKFRPGT
jgi:subtilisin family serine protease